MVSSPPRILAAVKLHRDGLLTWAENHLPMMEGRFDRATAHALPVTVDGKLACVVVYSNWRGGSVEVSIAATTPLWARRGIIADILAWPFHTLDVRRITAVTAVRNARSRRLQEGLGFRLEGTLRDYFADDDAVIYGMTRDDFNNSKWAA